MTLEEEFSGEKGIDLQEEQEPLALLVGVYSGATQLASCQEHLEELESLAQTFDVPAAEKIACPLRKIDPATYLSKGKLQEIATKIHASKANLLIFDEEISPAQQRNLEKFLRIAVMDRTELIIEIFSQRAQTKEARLQVELARIKYEFPRLKRLWSHFSRQRARGGFLKGEGEKQIEIDRRLLQRRLERLNEEIQQVKKHRDTQRAARLRSQIPTFALVGYTNVGKSTLLNALTEADVFVENKLFATLDPTTRKYILPNKQEVLITDTVGFIRKLPHTLITAFRSTLESTIHDDVLLHVIDVSHPSAEHQAEATSTLLKELGVEKQSVITVLNKIDKCHDEALCQRLQVRYPKTVCISASEKQGFQDLMEIMMQELSSRRQTVKLRIPQSEYVVVTQLYSQGRVLYEEYEGNDVIIRVEVPLLLLSRLRIYQDE